MNSILLIRRKAALLSLLSVGLLAGCGGGGGSTPSTPAAKTAKAFKTANVAGSFDPPTRGLSRSLGATACTIQFTNDNNGDRGAATFTSGAAGDGTFAAYAATVSGLAFTDQVYDDAAQKVTGTVDFDLTDFTPNAVFVGTAHFHGAYVVDSKFHPTLNGAIVGSDGTVVNLSLDYQIGAGAIDLTGTYGGSVKYGGVPVSTFKDLILKGVSGDLGRVSGTIPFTLPNTTVTTNLTFEAGYTRSALAGGFNLPTDVPAAITTLKAGSPAQVYLSTVDKGKNVAGTLVIVNRGDGQTYAFELAAKKTSSSTGGSTGGGTTSTNLKVGYYDGGVKGSNGQLDGRIVKLNVVKSGATLGANGSMILVESGAAPNIGGRIASVTGSGDTVTITVDHMTSTYTKWVLTGTISGTSLNLTYTATRLDGSTNTGSFDQLGKVDQTTPNLSGSYTGSLTAASSTTPSPFAGVLKATGDGSVTMTTNSTVLGNVTLPPLSGYIAGTSIALKDSSEGRTLPSPYTGNTLYGNFGGEVSGNAITGKYVIFVDSSTGTPLFSEYGSLALQKG